MFFSARQTCVTVKIRLTNGPHVFKVHRDPRDTHHYPGSCPHHMGLSPPAVQMISVEIQKQSQ